MCLQKIKLSVIDGLLIANMIGPNFGYDVVPTLGLVVAFLLHGGLTIGLTLIFIKPLMPLRSSCQTLSLLPHSGSYGHLWPAS
jgi:hypothetical protein